MLIPSLQTRCSLKQGGEQAFDGRSFRQFNGVWPSQAPKLGKVLDLDQHSGLQNADERQVSVSFLVVEPVTDDELVRDIEPNIISSNR